MSSKFVLVCEVNDDGATVASEIAATGVGGNPYTAGADAWRAVDNIGRYLQNSATNGRGIKISYFDTAVSASITGTFTGDPSNNDTVTVNGVAFTGVTGTPVANQYKITSGSVTANAAALAAAINASVTAGIVNVVGASSALGVVTFFSIVPGEVGKNIPITEATANFTVAAATFTTGGTKAHSAVISAGIA